MKNALKNAVSLAAGGTFVAGTTALALTIVSAQVPGAGEVTATLRCAAGIPAPGSRCVTDALSAAQSARAQAEAALAGQNLVFEEGPVLGPKATIVVGTMYRDAKGKTGLIRSFCWAIVDKGGLDPRVGLAVQDSSGDVTTLDVSAADVAVLEIDAGEVRAAQDACPWPVGFVR